MALALADRPDATTVDAFLGGRVAVVQPAEGHHRAGLEAVLLAAGLDASEEGTVVDLGAGAGVAGLAVASRCAAARVVLVERDPMALACARASLSLATNRPLADRVRIVSADIAAPESALVVSGLRRASADVVIANPPFNDARATVSPLPARAEAHVLGDGALDDWLQASAWLLKPRGRLIIIFRADRLDDLLAACRGRFGSLDVLPVHPRAGAPAHRIVICGIKGGRTPLRLLPPFVLHEAGSGRFTPAADAVLRVGTSLGEAAALPGR